MKTKILSAATLLIASLMAPMAISAQTTYLSTFEDGITEGTQFVDHWYDSPFVKGTCHQTIEVIDNPLADNYNSTEKVLHYIRPYYASDRNGALIKLEHPFTTSPTTQYLHVMVHKPVSSRIILSCISQGDDVYQLYEVSRTESRAGLWTDAVFAIKGNNDVIDRIVVYADAEYSVNRLAGDIDIYLDEIVISNSQDPRSVTSYCVVDGSADANRYISSIATTGASLDVKATLQAAPSVFTLYSESAVVTEPGAPIELTFKQASTDANTPRIADVYVDINGDKEFDNESEYIGRIAGVAQGAEVVYTTEFTIPVGTPVAASRIRIKTTDASDVAAPSACGNVVKGQVVDLPLEIVRASEKPIIRISGYDEQSGWGAVRFAEFDGTEVKVMNGKRMKLIATPAPGYTFVGWYNDATGGFVSADPQFTFTATFDVKFLAKFAEIPYCTPVGNVPADLWLNKISVAPAGQSALYFAGSASTTASQPTASLSKLSVMGGVNLRRGSQATLVVAPSTTTGYINVWGDWNCDHEFTADEFVGSVPASSPTVQIAVPTTALSATTALRVAYTASAAAADAACADLANGSAYDLAVTVVPGADERFSLSAVPSIAGAATFTLSPAPGADGKYAAGTNVEITCVPAAGYDFVQWMKDGMPFGATMTSNNPLPVTGLSADLEIVMKMEAKFPDYCEGTAPNNGDGNHYGVTSGGTITVNDVEVFTYSFNDNAIEDYSSSCVANVCPGDVIGITVSGASDHMKWAQGELYIDWNMDGTFNTTSDECYIMFNNGNQTTYSYQVTVPDNVGEGCFGMRINVGESPNYNSYGGGPCKARRRGTLQTFRINSTALPLGDPMLNITKTEGCTVVVTDSDHNPVSNKEVIYNGETYYITVIVSDDYRFSGVEVNGEEISMYEGNDGVFTGEFIANERGAQVNVVTVPVVVEYRHNTGTTSRADRGVTTITVKDGSSNTLGTVAGNGTSSNRAVYVDRTSTVFEVTPGMTLDIQCTSGTGTWMHSQIYIDYNRDGHFTAILDEANHTVAAGSELVAFNRGQFNDSWYNSAGVARSTGEALYKTSTNDANRIPAFTLPANLAPGDYRIRYMVDWKFLSDADGLDSERTENYLGKVGSSDNGGTQIDFTLRVPAQEFTLTTSASGNGSVAVYSAVYTDGDGNLRPTGAPLTGTVTQGTRPYVFFFPTTDAGLSSVLVNGEDYYDHLTHYVTETSGYWTVRLQSVTGNVNISAIFDDSLSAIEGVVADANTTSIEYFNINGVRINADNLTNGIYIRRCGTKTDKVIILK